MVVLFIPNRPYLDQDSDKAFGFFDIFLTLSVYQPDGRTIGFLKYLRIAIPCPSTHLLLAEIRLRLAYEEAQIPPIYHLVDRTVLYTFLIPLVVCL